MVKAVAFSAYDMEAFLPYGHGFGIFNRASPTKLTVEFQGNVSTMLGNYTYSPAVGAPEGTFHSFTEAKGGRAVLKITGMNVDAAEFTLFMTQSFQDSFNRLVYSGNDIITGSRAADNLLGLTGRDVIAGGRGHDTIDGGDGKDRLDGGGGNDALNGGAQGDILKGAAGRDTLDGGAGNDRLTGGGGADVFEFSRGGDRDTITDFRLAQGDKLALSSLLGDFGDSAADIIRDHGQIVRGNLVLSFGEGDVLTLQGVGSMRALIARGLTEPADDPFGF